MKSSASSKTPPDLGFRKFRLTGGEPLVRKDIVEIARRIWDLPGVQSLGISTNGLLLKELAVPLKQAGVRSVNISLDTLDPAVYQKAHRRPPSKPRSMGSMPLRPRVSKW